jgi:hypothetical protein
MTFSRKDFRITAPAFLFFVILSALSLNLPFFWDTILYSKIAHWFLENNFSSLVVPQVLDTGNQTFFELLLALSWKICGKALWTSHLIIVPFLLGIVIQYYFLARKYIPESPLGPSLIFLMLEPTLLAQSTMVSLDIIIVFFYLLGLNAILSGKKRLLVIAALGLSLTNLRGATLISALALTEALVHRNINPRKLLPYIPGVCVFAGWLCFHYLKTGWIINQPDEWSEHRQMIGAQGMVRNLLFIIWRFFDFGKFAVWLFAGAVLLNRIRNKGYPEKKEKELFLLAAVPFILLTLVFLPFSNPIGHRYFMPVYLLLLLVACYQFQFIVKRGQRVLLYCILAISFVAGHLITYPPPLSNGWDSFVTHILYFPLRDKMTGYILDNGIPPAEVCTDFPLNSSYRFTNLCEKDLEFSNKYFGGINKYNYVIQSNINNRFYKSELDALRTEWQMVKEFVSGPVYIRLYKSESLKKFY